jgi:catechol 2,3-dioxygenase-like lactoylglutathione lyase family enzyme
MTPIASFSLVAIDCPDALTLARFYSAITGWEIEVPNWLSDGATVTVDDARWLQLVGDQGATIAFQQISDFVAPTWPGGEHPQQIHLDFDVDDLDLGEAAVLEIGARSVDLQPDPTEFRVFLDPAGHPFCLVRAAPTAT